MILERPWGELRTDGEPLTKRFPILEAPLEVQWMSGTHGDSRNPGPSTYWIDSVITLSDDQIDGLTAAYSPASNDQTPSLVDGMKEYLPPGPFQTSDTPPAALCLMRNIHSKPWTDQMPGTWP